jgi:periodic tryptophan protein 2
MNEFGNIALVEERDEREGGNVVLKLPGVKKGDMAGRTVKPEVLSFTCSLYGTN